MAKGGKLVSSSEKPRPLTSSMASLVKTRCQTRELQKQHGKDIDQQEIGSQQMIQQEKIDEQENFNQVERVSGQGKKKQRVCMVNGKTLTADKPLKDSADLRPITNHQDRVVERNTSKKNAQIKTLISPGSLGAYVRMKKNPRVQEQLSDGFPKKPIIVRNFSSLDQRMESSQKRQVSYSQYQLFDDDSGFGLGLVQENEAFQSLDEHVFEGEKDSDPKEIENDVFEIENESRQPIGPDKVTLGKFSRFLGSLARDSNLAPLNELDWRLVRDKDKIWDYVKKKFIISEEGKNYVLQSVGVLWRTHKTRVKQKYYNNPNNIDIRTGSSVPDSHLKDLLNYWNLEEVQEQAEGKPPSLALMYMETHKRTPGKNYKTAEVRIEQIEYKDQELLGRCSKKVKGHSKSSVIIADEFLQPYRDEIVKDTIAGVLKMLEHLPSDVLAPIDSSFENRLGVPEFTTNLINGQSSQGINDTELCQDDQAVPAHARSILFDSDWNGQSKKTQHECRAKNRRMFRAKRENRAGAAEPVDRLTHQDRLNFDWSPTQLGKAYRSTIDTVLLRRRFLRVLRTLRSNFGAVAGDRLRQKVLIREPDAARLHSRRSKDASTARLIRPRMANYRASLPYDDPYIQTPKYPNPYTTPPSYRVPSTYDDPYASIGREWAPTFDYPGPSPFYSPPISLPHNPSMDPYAPTRDPYDPGFDDPYAQLAPPSSYPSFDSYAPQIHDSHSWSYDFYELPTSSSYTPNDDPYTIFSQDSSMAQLPDFEPLSSELMEAIRQLDECLARMETQVEKLANEVDELKRPCIDEMPIFDVVDPTGFVGNAFVDELLKEVCTEVEIEGEENGPEVDITPLVLLEDVVVEIEGKSLLGSPTALEMSSLLAFGEDEEVVPVVEDVKILEPLLPPPEALLLLDHVEVEEVVGDVLDPTLSCPTTTNSKVERVEVTVGDMKEYVDPFWDDHVWVVDYSLFRPPKKARSFVALTIRLARRARLGDFCHPVCLLENTKVWHNRHLFLDPG
ncbi:hypothetical protein PHJA_001884400 [Phtheirospermum japonicum]|uniref:Uncharacterized protein n=1 Tax=Phtheirospermum japonicum TaxID=374723 RepID=A0A830CNH1_9LAMI|nr:hypothetical protein PHJA_001884400 [Phtheirospermum japonicum]